MSRSVWMGLLVVAIVGLSVGSRAAEQRKAPAGATVARVHANVVPSGSTRAVGTQQFDNDVPFRRDGTDGGTVGNRFHSNTPPYSIATVSFAAAGNFATSMVMTVWQVNPANVTVKARSLVSGIAQSPGTMLRFSAALAAPIVGQTLPVIAGLRNTDYDPCAGGQALASTCDGVALTQGVAPAVVFRGRRVNFNSGSFVPTINTVASTGTALPGPINAIFRVTGDNLPVELTSFSVH